MGFYMNNEQKEEQGMKAQGLDGVLSDGHGVFGRVGRKINTPWQQQRQDQLQLIERLKVLVWVFGLALIASGLVISALLAALRAGQ